MVAVDQETTVHIFAWGQDYIELVLQPPGELLVGVLERHWGIPASRVRALHRVDNPPIENQKPHELVYLLEMVHDRSVRPPEIPEVFVLIQIVKTEIVRQKDLHRTRKRETVRPVASRLQRAQFMWDVLIAKMILEIPSGTVELVLTVNNVVWLPNDDSVRTILDGDFFRIDIFHS